MLAARVNVAEAPLQPPTLEQGSAASKLVHQVRRLDRALGLSLIHI